LSTMSGSTTISQHSADCNIEQQVLLGNNSICVPFSYFNLGDDRYPHKSIIEDICISLAISLPEVYYTGDNLVLS
jgi:hypothetical protein